jgi:outer membrane lipoprotein-sorting protein
MLVAALALNNYSSHFQMLVYKDKQIIKETGTIYFRKPRLLRIEVKQGPKKGALAILGSDGRVHGHLGGILSIFGASISPDSDLARAINGFPLVGTDYYSLVQDLKNMLKQGDGSLATQEPIPTDKTTIATYILDMYLPKSKNNKNDLLLKRIYINPQTYLPIFWEDYVDGKLWSESLWYDLQNNLTLPDSLFSI